MSSAKLGWSFNERDAATLEARSPAVVSRNRRTAQLVCQTVMTIRSLRESSSLAHYCRSATDHTAVLISYLFGPVRLLYTLSSFTSISNNNAVKTIQEDQIRAPADDTGYGIRYLSSMRTKLGDRSFAAAGPRLWNSLPGHLRQSETLAIFKRQLKTFLFSV